MNKASDSRALKIAHVVPSFFPATIYGGPTVSVYQLCRALMRSGTNVRVLTTNANGMQRGAILDVDTQREVILADGLPVRYCRRVAVNSKSPALLAHLPEYIGWANVVHLTAVYSFPIIPTLAIARVLNKPVVWSPRGMLQRWDGTSRPRIKNLWEQVCRFVAPQRLVLHVTSEAEAEACRERLPNVKTFLAPNGADLDESLLDALDVAPRHRLAGSDGDKQSQLDLLYIGRLHEKKGIENLLHALAIVRADMPLMVRRLVISGTGEASYVEKLKRLVDELNLSRTVTMTGHVEGAERERVFATSDVVVVPSFVENFGMVIAESLVRYVPVIASRGTPWQRIAETNCGLWIENSPTELAQAVRQIALMPRREMGRRGHELIRREFSWNVIADKLNSLYTELARS